MLCSTNLIFLYKKPVNGYSKSKLKTVWRIFLTLMLKVAAKNAFAFEDNAEKVQRWNILPGCLWNICKRHKLILSDDIYKVNFSGWTSKRGRKALQ